jgi:signal transduction histidine kinase
VETEAELLRLALDALEDPLAIHTIVRDESGAVVDFRYVYANPAAEVVLGVPAEQMAGRLLGNVVPQFRESSLYATYVGVAESKRSALHEVRWTHAERGEVVFEVQVLPLDDSIVSCARDMTARLEAIAQREVAEAERAEAGAQLAIASERERIAGDLHQTLVRDLFEVVLRLHTAAELADPDTRVRLADVIDRVDDAITKTRGAVFATRASGEEPALAPRVTE